MRKYLFLCVIWLTLFVIIPAGAQELPDEAQLAAWEAFNQAHDDQWTVHWNPKTGTPKFIYSSVTEPVAGTPEQAARVFLQSLAEVFKQPASFADIRDVRVQENKGRRHVRLEQTFHGIPIHGAEYLVHILPDGRIYMVNGTLYRDVQANLNRKINETEAVETVKKDLGQPLDQATVETELLIYPDNEFFRLTWKVDVASHTGRFNWSYFVDALDGATIKKQDNIDYDDGTGNVYLKHPFLTPNTTTVTLENLDGSGYLRGTYADVFTSEEYWLQQQEPNQRAQSASLNFEYSPSDWQFDEANVYYHINVFKQWMIDNYHSSSEDIVTARVHELDPANNAFFSPPSNVTFGEGSGAGYNDHAREEVVVYHEYIHAMVWPIVDFETELPDYAETGAISEGLADYFPGSFTGRSLKGEYVREGFVPREDYPSFQRDMADPLIDHYDRYEDPNDPIWVTVVNNNQPFQEIHVGGEFFSSILWDIRGAIGQSVADELAWDALYHVTSTAEFVDFRIAMVNLDFIEYNSAHTPTIESKFDTKGIYAPLDAHITGPVSLLQGEQATWDCNPSGGQGTRTYKWYIKEPPSASSWTQVGSNQTYTRTMGTSDFDLRVEVTAGSETVYDKHLVTYDDGSNPWKRYVGDNTTTAEIPETYQLSQNYPNPFNPSTTIRYQIPEAAHVTIRIYDVLGKEVTRLLDQTHSAGYYDIQWDGKDDAGRAVASGIYIYRIEAEEYKAVRKLAILR